MYQFKPLVSILRPNGVTSNVEIIFLFTLAVIFPLVGAFIALHPMFRKEKKTKKHSRRFYIFNTIVAVFLIFGVLLLTKELSQEIYACDIMNIINCD
jgi:heme/copper-type cytochrome/quinol oxidase subunit 4